MANAWYNRGLYRIGSGATAWASASGLKALLVGSGFTFDKTHNFVSQITELPNGTGYTGGFAGSGRKALASKAVTEDDGNNRVWYDAADITWSAIDAGTIYGIVIAEELTSDADSPLIGFLDPTNLVTNGGDVIAQFNATTGLFMLSN